MQDKHLIVVLQCDECGSPHAGCRDLACALSSRPYAGEDVVPVEQLWGAVDRSAFESIIHDWTCGCGKGERCPDRDGCREAADQIVAHFGGRSDAPAAPRDQHPKEAGDGCP